MTDPPDDQDLLRLWQAGNEEAARQIVDRYVERLVGLARGRISQRLASRIDPEDVVQSVFRTFFHRAKEGQFHIEDKDDLCKLLARITVHKALRQVRFHQAEKRDPRLEMGQRDETHGPPLDFLDREPTPEETNAFLDQLEVFLNHLKPRERQILELRMQGYSSTEIAHHFNITDRSVRRVLERIRGQAEAQGLQS
ncbi:MAG: RNA polymerase sigma factor [Gemmataceae bacterium]